MHMSCLMKFYCCCMYTKTASNKSYLFKETKRVVKLLRTAPSVRALKYSLDVLFFVDANLHGITVVMEPRQITHHSLDPMVSVNMD